MWWLFTKKKKKKLVLPVIRNSNPKLLDCKWIDFKKQKPPHEVVLAAFDSYDCGWVMSTVWWYEEKQCWMFAGPNISIEAGQQYTHWRPLPKLPNLTKTT